MSLLRGSDGPAALAPEYLEVRLDRLEDCAEGSASEI